MITVYIGLGSNLAKPQQQLADAVEAINNIPNSALLTVSSLYASKPMGPQEQPDYINAVLAINTSLAPLALLDALQSIELASGRVRKQERWGARTLDLDILLYGQSVINNERLTIPHYGMKVREFVLLPLAEIAPDLVLPDNSNIKNLAANIPTNGLTKLADPTRVNEQ